MNTFKRSLIGLTVAAALSGCGSSSDSTTSPNNSTEINGVAIKGTLSNANVVAYKYVNGNEVEAAKTTTNDSGQYTLDVKDYTGPLKIEISPSEDANNPTLMTCDAVDGCGDKNFGEELNLTDLDPNFELNAIAVFDPKTTTAQKINVSAVTHLAAAVIEKNPIDSANIQKVLVEVSNALKIFGDINELEPTNVNDIAAVANENNDKELNYGLVNAAIAEQLFANEADADGILSTKLEAAATDLANNGGEFLSTSDNDNSNFELNVVDILTDIKVLVTQLKQEIAADTLSDAPKIDTDIVQNITDALTNIDSDLVHVIAVTEESADPVTGRIEVVSDIVTEGGPIDIAAGLVQDLRLLVNLFDTTTTSGQDLNAGAQEYNILANNAATMLQQESDSFTLLTELSAAIADVELMQEATNSTTVTYDLSDLRAQGSSLTGTITYDTVNKTFAVNAADGDQSAQLSAQAAILADNKSLKVTVAGDINSAGATLTLVNTSAITINFGQTITTAMLEADDSDIEPIAGQLQLDAVLSQKLTTAVTDPMRFSGNIKADLVTVIAPEVRQEYSNWDGNSNTVNIALEPILLPQSLSLSGELTSEDAMASVILTVGLPDAATYQAAGLETVGKKIAQNYTVEVSADGNTVTETLVDGYTGELVFSANADGSSSYTYKRTADDAASSTYGATFSSTHYISQKTVDAGIEYFLAGDFADSEGKGGYNITISPMANDLTGEISGYQVLRATIEYDANQLGDGTVLNAETHELNYSQGGQSRTEERFFDSLADYLNSGFARYNVAPEQLTSALTVYQSMMAATGGSRNHVTDVGEVLILNTASLEELTNGNSLILDSYVTNPLFNDAIKLVVSDSGNNVSVYVDNHLTKQIVYSNATSTDGNFTLEVVSGDGQPNMVLTSATQAVDNITQPKLTLTTTDNYSVSTKTLTPIDNNGDQVADEYMVCETRTISDSGSTDDWRCYTSPDTVISTYSGIASYFDPLTVSSALEIFQSAVATGKGYGFSAWVDGIGQLEYQLTDDDKTAIAALSTTPDSTIPDSTTLFDAQLTNVDDTLGLENDSQYLQANANLTLKAVLGDYNITLAVTANRTAFEAGKADLTVTYKLPNESSQRRFVIAADSTVEDQLVVTNAEGVSITLTKAPDDAASSDTETLLGLITVDGEQVAKVVDRSGIALIIYSNGAVESI